MRLIGRGGLGELEPCGREIAQLKKTTFSLATLPQSGRLTADAVVVIRTSNRRRRRAALGGGGRDEKRLPEARLFGRLNWRKCPPCKTSDANCFVMFCYFLRSKPSRANISGEQVRASFGG